MTSVAIAQHASGVMIFLADAAVRSIVLACLAALALAGLRVRHVTVHLAVWTGVLYAALAMPLLAWMMPAISLRVPVQLISAGAPSPEPARGQSAVDGRIPGVVASVRTSEGRRSITGAVAAPQVGRQEGAAGKLLQLGPKLGQEVKSALARLPRIAAPARILALYILGLAFFLGRLITGLFLGGRLRRRFTRVGDPRALQWLDRGARAMGLKRAPSLAESRAVSVPLTVGVFHPVIVIPSGWREWPIEKLAAVIAHEVSHVRRNDSLTRAAALVYQCIFWFSPLGWWLERCLTDLAEQASDEAAIRAGAEPAEYAAILLSFFDISTRQGRVSWQGVSMAHGWRARKRIERVLVSAGALPAATKTPILVLLALCALPIVWLTAATRPVLVGSVDSVASKPLTRNVGRQQFLPPVAASPEISPLAPTAPLDGSSFPVEKTGQHQTAPQAMTPEASTGFYPWLKSPGVYFGTKEERRAFSRLTSDEERKQFIEQFWERPQGAWRKEMDSPYKKWFSEEVPYVITVKASGKEIETPYTKWLSEEVPYIITEQERAAFKKLDTDAEREDFIEKFWERRNPHPGSPQNEFKEEYYRRIAYANEHYASRIPGWKTDRGRIYIMYGPPDEVDSHPKGGSYQRPDSEGGGETFTFPFERWRYRYIDGIGNNIILEFVDADMNGAYHLTMDPGEKDALLHVPGAGQTREDSSLQPPLTASPREVPPITMCIVIDNSGSMHDKREGVMAAALALVQASQPHDEVGIVDFDDEASSGLPDGRDFTSDIKEMEAALSHIDSRGGSAMRDAIEFSINHLKQAAHNDRTVLVLITDGDDNASNVTQEQLLGKIKNSGVRIYCIGLLSEDDRREAKAARRTLGQLAEASGGLAYYPKDLAEVERISAEIAIEVRKP
jgi:GWxTD domain-containing protein